MTLYTYNHHAFYAFSFPSPLGMPCHYHYNLIHSCLLGSALPPSPVPRPCGQYPEKDIQDPLLAKSDRDE